MRVPMCIRVCAYRCAYLMCCSSCVSSCLIAFVSNVHKYLCVYASPHLLMCVYVCPWTFISCQILSTFPYFHEHVSSCMYFWASGHILLYASLGACVYVRGRSCACFYIKCGCLQMSLCNYISVFMYACVCARAYVCVCVCVCIKYPVVSCHIQSCREIPWHFHVHKRKRQNQSESPRLHFL